MAHKKRTRLPPGVQAATPDRFGNARWLIRWKDSQGGDHRRTVSAPTAQAASLERERRLASGTAAALQPNSKGEQLRDAVPLFLATRTTPSTRMQDASNLRRLSETFGDRTMASITALELQTWLDGLRQQSGRRYDPKSRVAFRRSCRVLWAWAVKAGHADANVAKPLEVTDLRERPKGPVPRTAKRHATVEELRVLFAALAEVAPPVIVLLLRTQFRLGLRVSEVCMLREQAIDWDTGHTTIDRAISAGEIGPTKSGRASSRYLSIAGREELRRHADTAHLVDGYLFTKTRMVDRHPFYSPKVPQRLMREALTLVGGLGLAPGTSTHLLRHSWDRIAEDFAASVGPSVIAAILGNQPATAKANYMAGPGLLASHIAEHMEALVFGG